MTTNPPPCQPEPFTHIRPAAERWTKPDPLPSAAGANHQTFNHMAAYIDDLEAQRVNLSALIAKLERELGDKNEQLERQDVEMREAAALVEQNWRRIEEIQQEMALQGEVIEITTSDLMLAAYAMSSYYAPPEDEGMNERQDRAMTLVKAFEAIVNGHRGTIRVVPVKVPVRCVITVCSNTAEIDADIKDAPALIADQTGWHIVQTETRVNGGTSNSHTGYLCPDHLIVDMNA
jgi:predicted nucleic acid-binding protein